jgi:hypothetical protein
MIKPNLRIQPTLKIKKLKKKSQKIPFLVDINNKKYHMKDMFKTSDEEVHTLAGYYLSHFT